MRIAFFGTPTLTVPVLDTLQASSLTPSLIIAAPDKPVGRKQILTSPPSADWAKRNHVQTWQPASKTELMDLNSPLYLSDWDVFVVFAYGRILPRLIIDLPRFGTLNLHPSLLPKLRGPSPIRSAILTNQRHTGVTVIKLDEEMDAGPIVAQTVISVPETDWPMNGPQLDQLLVSAGADLLADTIPRWCAGELKAQPQDHTQATYCQLTKKEDARLDIDPSALPSGETAYQALLKIKAYAGWPVAFFEHNRQRVKILDASLDATGKLIIHQVIPAGKNELSFEQYVARSNQC